MKNALCLVVLVGCLGDGQQQQTVMSEPGNGADPGNVDLANGCSTACDSPPQSYCLDANTLRKYAAIGRCAMEQCTYQYSDALCAAGCQGGTCMGNDPCNGVACNAPPTPSCIDSQTLQSYSSSGTCSAGNCSYSSITTHCANGCASGACTGDPCAGVSCDQPQAAACLDSKTLRTYSSSGACNNGTCTYSHSDTTCAHGCTSAMCSGDPCAGVVCDQPPANQCFDVNTAQIYSPVGSCSNGACTYSPTKQACTEGCQRGACCTPETDGQFCARLGKQCGSFTAPDNCGASRTVASCGDCSGLTTCGGGGTPNVCGNQPICSPDGWCWDNPSPQGLGLNAIWTSAAGDVWVAGDGGTLLHWDGAKWSGQMLISDQRFLGIWGTSNSSIWIVGSGGTLLNWNGSAAAPVTSPTGSNLNAVWGTAASSVWAVGDGGTVLHWDGSRWSQQTISTSARLNTIWGLSATDIWIGGEQTSLHWNGSTWSAIPTNNASITGFWGSASNDVWAATGSGVSHWDGFSWTDSTQAGCTAVTGAAANDVLCVGDFSSFYHFDGLGWKEVFDLHSPAMIKALGGDGSSGLLAVGDAGEIYRLNGGTHSTGGDWLVGGILPIDYVSIVNSVALSSTTVYSGGSGGLMQRYAAGWAPVFNGFSDNPVLSLSASSPSNLWKVDSLNGHKNLFFYDGTSWIQQFPSQIPDGVLALSANDVWGVAGDKTYHWNGSVWSAVPNAYSGTAIAFTALAGSASNDVWMGSNNGKLMHWNGSTWASVASGVSSAILRISAPAANCAFAAGSFGMIVWDGTSWKTSPGISSGLSVWARSSSSAWAVDASHNVFQWNGTAWSVVPTLRKLSIPVDVTGFGKDVWVIGENSTVLHHTEP